MVSRPPLRVLVGKAGLDKHDRGARIVARALRDAGYEVVYLPAGRMPAEIAEVAVDEDVAAIGLSVLSGAHRRVFSDLLAALDDHDAGDIRVFAGGTIPPADTAELEQMGVTEVFGPGATTEQIVASFDRELRHEGAGR